jgi:hypothetical protein
MYQRLWTIRVCGRYSKSASLCPSLIAGVVAVNTDIDDLQNPSIFLKRANGVRSLICTLSPDGCRVLRTTTWSKQPLPTGRPSSQGESHCALVRQIAAISSQPSRRHTEVKFGMRSNRPHGVPVCAATGEVPISRLPYITVADAPSQPCSLAPRPFSLKPRGSPKRPTISRFDRVKN